MGHAFRELQSQERRKKKNTTPSRHVCEGCHTIMREISGFKYDTSICLMALPPSESMKRLVQLKESCARVSLLKSTLFLQKVTCLSLELNTKMHSLAAVLQRKKGNTWSRFVQSLHLDFMFTFATRPLGESELSKTRSFQRRLSSFVLVRHPACFDWGCISNMTMRTFYWWITLIFPFPVKGGNGAHLPACLSVGLPVCLCILKEDNHWYRITRPWCGKQGAAFMFSILLTLSTRLCHKRVFEYPCFYSSDQILAAETRAGLHR